jgi:peptide/nickel transport system substrate-binding protein
MENRFGIKDLLICVLVLVAIGLVALNMLQVDRQWKMLQDLGRTSDEHTRDLVKIEGALERGVSVAGPTTQGAGLSTGQGAGPAGMDVTWAGPGMQSPDVVAEDVAKRDPFRLIKQAEAMPGFSRGDWLVDNLRAKVKALTPFVAEDIPSVMVDYRIMETLCFRDVDTLKFMPLLARDWNISKDGKTITFYLRQGVTWSDGMPFTSDDVVFTYEWIMNKDVKAPRQRSYLENFVSCKANGPYEVVFNFSKFIYNNFESVGADNEILARHFYSRYTPEQFNESVGLVLGTGPYRLDDPAGWHPGTPIVLRRNERYWGEPPPPDRLLYLELEEEASWQSAFSNGEMDIYDCYPEQFVRLQKDPHIMQIGQPIDFPFMLNGYNYIGWNERRSNKPSIFADKRVRQALTMLIDRQKIVDQVFLGLATVPHGMFAPNSPQSDPDLKPWPYDPARAKKMLAELGWADRDGSGILSDAQGHPFHFTLVYPNKQTIYDRITSLIKDELAEAGIQMDRDPTEWPVMLKRLDERDFDAIMLAWSSDVENDPYQEFSSTQIADQGDNTCSYVSPELDAAMDQARGCVDEAQRMQLWHKCDDIVTDDCPYTFLITRHKTWFVNRRWQNVRKSVMGLNLSTWKESPVPWFVPVGMQRYREP